MNDTVKSKRPRRPAGSRNSPRSGEISGCLEGGTSVIEELKDEMSEWQSSLESNSMEHLPKYDEVTEAVDALEAAVDALQSIDCPDWITDFPVSYTQDTRTSANSRSGRMDNARQELDAALAGAQQWLEENEELTANDPNDEEDGDPDEDEVTEEQVDERTEQRDAVETFVQELEDAIGELDNVSFPGMY
jgi:hypothetical protein